MHLDPQVWKALQSHFQSLDSSSSTSRVITQDIHDGRKYKELKDFTSQGNLTLVVNTDGIQLFKSSTVSMWPIWILINELPVSLRYVNVHGNGMS